jgi:hypothetical protein
METDRPNATNPSIEVIRALIGSTFVDAGYLEIENNDPTALVKNIYSGKGMVWAVQVLDSFDEFLRLWVRSTGAEARIVAALTQVATADQRWNLSLIVVVREQLKEELISDISRFQEEASSFARFVIALESSDAISHLRAKLLALLMQWMDDLESGTQETTTIDQDINKVVENAAAEYGISSLNTLADSLRSRNPSDESVLTSILNDLRRQMTNEAK